MRRAPPQGSPGTPGREGTTQAWQPRRVLHLFSGPGERPDGIAALLRLEGWECDDVDKVNSGPHQDIADAIGWAVWLRYIRGGHYSLVLLGTPCETFSHARGYGPGPRPLRSVEEIYGLKDRTPGEREQLRLANLLVMRTVEAAYAAEETGAAWIIENPRPWQGAPSLWLYPEVAQLIKATGAHWIEFDQCCYGAKATKPTRLVYSSRIDLSHFACRCAHPATRWNDAEGREYWAPHERLVGRKTSEGKWATNELKAYPRMLNEEFVKTIIRADPWVWEAGESKSGPFQ